MNVTNAAIETGIPNPFLAKSAKANNEVELAEAMLAGKLGAKSLSKRARMGLSTYLRLFLQTHEKEFTPIDEPNLRKIASLFQYNPNDPCVPQFDRALLPRIEQILERLTKSVTPSISKKPPGLVYIPHLVIPLTYSNIKGISSSIKWHLQRAINPEISYSLDDKTLLHMIHTLREIFRRATPIHQSTFFAVQTRASFFSLLPLLPPELTDLNLYNLQLNDADIETVIRGFPCLTGLTLNIGQVASFSLKTLECLANIVTLQELRLVSQLPRNGMRILAEKAKLSKLDLSQAGARDDDLEAIANSPTFCLSHLDLSGCTSITDKGLLMLIGSPLFKQLRFLSLKGCTGISEEGMLALVRKIEPHMSELNLSSCPGVTEKVIESFEEIGSIQLKQLDIWFSTGATVAGLERVRNLLVEQV